MTECEREIFLESFPMLSGGDRSRFLMLKPESDDGSGAILRREPVDELAGGVACPVAMTWRAVLAARSGGPGLISRGSASNS